jgi:uncharacterized protein (DUF2267 family)
MDANAATSKPSTYGLPASGEGMQFLEKVQRQAGLEDIYDARDIAEVVFRTMRDMMPNDVVDRITDELSKTSAANGGDVSSTAIVELWQDTNPLVRWLSRVRAPMDIKPSSFVFRISQEAGLSRGIFPEDAIAAVFTAMKAELSPERIREVEDYLPGSIRQLWRRI